jgi:hypothetical protein
MGKVVNLNRFRKQKAKADRAKQADINRRLHGRTKGERAREELQKQQLTRHVEASKLGEPVALAPDSNEKEAERPGTERPSGESSSPDSTGDED